MGSIGDSGFVGKPVEVVVCFIIVSNGGGGGGWRWGSSWRVRGVKCVGKEGVRWIETRLLGRDALGTVGWQGRREVHGMEKKLGGGRGKTESRREEGRRAEERG